MADSMAVEILTAQIVKAIEQLNKEIELGMRQNAKRTSRRIERLRAKKDAMTNEE